MKVFFFAQIAYTFQCGKHAMFTKKDLVGFDLGKKVFFVCVKFEFSMLSIFVLRLLRGAAKSWPGGHL